MAIAGAVSLSFAPRGATGVHDLFSGIGKVERSGSLGRVYQLVADCAQPKERPGLLRRW